MKNKSIVISLLVVLLFGLLNNVTLQAANEETYNLQDGEEYMDKTFVYHISEKDSGHDIKVICGERDVPTYDTKKGLITWIDYKVYSLEEIYGSESAGHIRAIINIAGPHLSKEEVITYLEGRTGITGLTYDEVVSAMQYSIWFFTDEDFRIPTTSNSEDLYRYFVTLPSVYNQVDVDLIELSTINTISYDDSVVMTFSYQSDSEAKLQHHYSKNLKTAYNVTESVTETDGITYVELEFPKISETIGLDFEVTVSGTLDGEKDVVVYAPDEQRSVQMLIGMGDVYNEYQLEEKSAIGKYYAYRLILDDDGDKTRTSHRSGTVLTLEDIEEINPSGKSGYVFTGWFDEGNIKVNESITMNRDRYLTAIYARDDSGDGDNPDGGDSGDGDNPDGGDSGDGDNPDGGDSGDGDNPDGGDSGDGDNPDGGDSGDGDNPDGGDSGDGDNPDGGDSGDGDNPDGGDSGDGDNPDGGDSGDGDNPDEFNEEDFSDEPTPEDVVEEFNEEDLPEWVPDWMPKTGGIPMLVFIILGVSLIVLGLRFKEIRNEEA